MSVASLPFCPYCGYRAVRRDSSFVYGRSYGCDMLVCANYPSCDAYVGCHKDGRPHGTLADPELRALRKRAHALFDPLWRKHPRGRRMRSEYYRRLALSMGIPLSECHIGMLDAEGCRDVIRLCENGDLGK